LRVVSPVSGVAEMTGDQVSGLNSDVKGLVGQNFATVRGREDEGGDHVIHAGDFTLCGVGAESGLDLGTIVGLQTFAGTEPLGVLDSLGVLGSRVSVSDIRDGHGGKKGGDNETESEFHFVARKYWKKKRWFGGGWESDEKAGIS